MSLVAVRAARRVPGTSFVKNLAVWFVALQGTEEANGPSIVFWLLEDRTGFFYFDLDGAAATFLQSESCVGLAGILPCTVVRCDNMHISDPVPFVLFVYLPNLLADRQIGGFWSLFLDQLHTVTTLAVLLALGFPLRGLGRRLGIPPSATLLFLGVAAGAHGFGLLSQSYEATSSQLSQTAFVILLLRAGLGMAPRSMARMVPGILTLGLVPALAEAALIAGGVRWFLFERWDLSLLAGFLIAAVSPAVILPTMLDQKSKGRGGPRLVPDRIMGMAVVNSFVAKTAILFLITWILADEAQRGSAHDDLWYLPLRLGLGLICGFLLGRLLARILPVASEHEGGRLWGGAGLVLFLALAIYFKENVLHIENVFAILALGLGIRLGSPTIADQNKNCFNGLWGVAEIPLFVNIGAHIEISRLTDPWLILGLLGLMSLGLAVRKWAAWLCTGQGDLTVPERFYVSLAQVPKATIQAVFGPVVFAALQTGNAELQEAAQMILIMAVLAIIATAPIGAVVLDRWGARLLSDSGQKS